MFEDAHLFCPICYSKSAVNRIKGFGTKRLCASKRIHWQPVVVEYELTEYAETLGGVLQALSEWGAKRKEMVKKIMQMREMVS